MTATGTTPRLRVGMLVCTARRPDMLRACLEALGRQVLPADVSAEICVIENDSEPASRSVVDEVASRSPLPVHYAIETRRGIPFARNRSLTEALAHGYDWIALIDDDEVAEPDWLAMHLATAQAHAAEVTYGWVRKRFERPAPDWWPPEVMRPDPEGTVLPRASTNNVAFSARLIRPDGSGLSYNPVFLNGYEDLDFFERAHAKGHRIVWAPRAVVTEDVPASRVEPERLIALVRASAEAHVQADILKTGYARAAVKYLVKGLRRLVGGAVLLTLARLQQLAGSRRAEHRYYKARLRLARASGNLQGVFGHRPDYYGTIDGR